MSWSLTKDERKLRRMLSTLKRLGLIAGIADAREEDSAFCVKPIVRTK